MNIFYRFVTFNSFSVFAAIVNFKKYPISVDSRVFGLAFISKYYEIVSQSRLFLGTFMKSNDILLAKCILLDIFQFVEERFVFGSVTYLRTTRVSYTNQIVLVLCTLTT